MIARRIHPGACSGNPCRSRLSSLLWFQFFSPTSTTYAYLLRHVSADLRRYPHSFECLPVVLLGHRVSRVFQPLSWRRASTRRLIFVLTSRPAVRSARVSCCSSTFRSSFFPSSERMEVSSPSSSGSAFNDSPWRLVTAASSSDSSVGSPCLPTSRWSCQSNLQSLLPIGLVPIVQWYRQVQKKKAAARALGIRETEWLSDARIERIQVWSMLAYYPLEHLCECWISDHRYFHLSDGGGLMHTRTNQTIDYLASKKIVPLSDQKLNKVGAWSCRFWA